jgi:hypothetical protein
MKPERQLEVQREATSVFQLIDSSSVRAPTRLSAQNCLGDDGREKEPSYRGRLTPNNKRFPVDQWVAPASIRADYCNGIVKKSSTLLGCFLRNSCEEAITYRVFHPDMSISILAE